MQSGRFGRCGAFALCFALALVMVSPVPAGNALNTNPMASDSVCGSPATTCMVGGSGIGCCAPGPVPVSAATTAGAGAGTSGHTSPITIRGYADALTSADVTRCVGGGVRVPGSDGSRVVAAGVAPSGDAVIGRAYGPDDAAMVADLVRHWAVGSLTTHLDTTYPFDPQYQSERVTGPTPASSADTRLGVRTVTDITVRQPYGIVVTDHHITHLDADTTADVYAAQCATRLIPGALAWPGSGYLTVSADISHDWADNTRSNRILDFTLPGDSAKTPTATFIYGTYYPSTRTNLSYVYQSSNLACIIPPTDTTAHWTYAADTDGQSHAVVTDEVSPLSIATIRNGYSGPVATCSVTARFHISPVQPAGLSLIDESAIAATLAFATEDTP